MFRWLQFAVITVYNENIGMVSRAGVSVKPVRPVAMAAIRLSRPAEAIPLHRSGVLAVFIDSYSDEHYFLRIAGLEKTDNSPISEQVLLRKKKFNHGQRSEDRTPSVYQDPDEKTKSGYHCLYRLHRVAPAGRSKRLRAGRRLLQRKAT